MRTTPSLTVRACAQLTGHGAFLRRVEAAAVGTRRTRARNSFRVALTGEDVEICGIARPKAAGALRAAARFACRGGPSSTCRGGAKRAENFESICRPAGAAEILYAPRALYQAPAPLPAVCATVETLDRSPGSMRSPFPLHARLALAASAALEAPLLNPSITVHVRASSNS